MGIYLVQFMDLARSLPGYCYVVFPHCRCDARKTGNIILTITLDGLRMRACSTEGVPEVSPLVVCMARRVSKPHPPPPTETGARLLLGYDKEL